jgi:Cdc6-like AAA superfamily ATPase
MVLQKNNLTQEHATSVADTYSQGGSSSLIMVIGKSGRGKTTSIENPSTI